VSETVVHRAWLVPTLRGYQRGWLRGDVVAGVAAGTVVVPQAMAYATIAGVPVEIGLYTCMLPMLVYALLGGSRSLSISTTSTIAVLTASALASMPAGRSADERLRDAFTLTLLVGVVLLALRLLRLGALVEQVSPATMTGVKAGVGLTVAVGQLPALLGVAAGDDSDGFLGKLGHVLGELGDVNAATCWLSAAAVATLVVLRRVAPQVPGPLVVVAGAIALVALTGLEDRGVALIDHVPRGLPTPTEPMWEDVGRLLSAALAIAVMAFLETVLVARAQRQRGEPPIDSDTELLANGVAALAGGLSQTLPPAGGFSQSAVNLRSGARSQVAGATTALLAVLVALFLGPVLEDLPRAILAAMVLVAVLGLVVPAEFTRLLRIDRAEFWVAVVTAALGLTAGLLLAVAVGVVLTLLLVLRNVSESKARVLLVAPDGRWTTDPHGGVPLAAELRVLALHLDTGLYTGNARPTQDAILALVLGTTPRPRTVVVEGSAVRKVTVPLLDTLEALDTDLGDEGITLLVAGLHQTVADRARRSAWFARLDGEGRVLPTVDAALTTRFGGGDPPTQTGAVLP
jgi:sulfate permease, SulP family